MARMYTLDGKLLCGSPEIRIGEKVYPVDDRKNNVKKAMKLFNDSRENDSDDNFENTEKLLELAFGKKYPEIEKLDLSFAAYQELVTLVIAAMTGDDPEELEKKKAEKDGSFPADSA